MRKILLTLFLMPAMAFAWQPNKIIEAYTPFSAGSANEIALRIVTKEIEQSGAARFAIISKPGAGGSLVNEFISKQTPDGYQVSASSIPALGATDKITLPNKEYSAKDFTYALNIASIPMTIVTLPNDPVNNIKDLARVLKIEKTTIGDPGAAARLVYELLVNHIGFKEGPNDVVRVEYKGPADTLNDVMGGHVRFGIMPLTVSHQSHLAGKVKIIAVTSNHTIKTLPNVQTASSTFPDLIFNLEVVMTLPKNTPKDIVDWYVKEFTKSLSNKDVVEQLENNMMYVNKNLLNSTNTTNYILDYEKKYTTIVNKVLSTQKK